jgi:hypothetical protein
MCEKVNRKNQIAQKLKNDKINKELTTRNIYVVVSCIITRLLQVSETATQVSPRAIKEA